VLHVTLPIVTKRLVLRPFTPDDLDDLYAILSRPDVVRYLYWDVQTRDQVREVLLRRVNDTHLAKDSDVLRLAIEAPGISGPTTAVIGEMSLWWRSAEHKQGEIGFMLHPEHHGRGFAAEASHAVLDLAFNELRLHRVYGRTDARNVASAALMQRLGMRQEAHLVHNEWFKGEWGDMLIFAILDHEWAERRLRGQT